MKKTQVMVNGLPGKMARLLAERIANDSRYELVRHSLTGLEITQENCFLKTSSGPENIQLISPYVRSERMQDVLNRWPELIMVDYTQPGATWQNCEDYIHYGTPFVMGTTGGDRNMMSLAIAESRISAVIAPNMSVPIVALMAMIEKGAADFPGALDGFELLITESHQSSKPDKSGTGKAIGEKLKILGANYGSEEDIIAIRDPKKQRFLGVPEEALGGHGYHTYELMSPDRSVYLKIEHDIDGRQTYVEGTLRAIDFLAQQVADGSFGRCFSMIDVMKG